MSRSLLSLPQAEFTGKFNSFLNHIWFFYKNLILLLINLILLLIKQNLGSLTHHGLTLNWVSNEVLWCAACFQEPRFSLWGRSRMDNWSGQLFWGMISQTSGKQKMTSRNPGYTMLKWQICTFACNFCCKTCRFVDGTWLMQRNNVFVW